MARDKHAQTDVKPFFVCLLNCADGSFYVGSTDDLENRLADHAAGLVGYTRKRLPVSLAGSFPVSTRDEARVRERQLKGWSHLKKEALSVGDWTRVHQLARRKRRASEPG
jgi:predicted GIY-YIG superfamily endonuclease